MKRLLSTIMGVSLVFIITGCKKSRIDYGVVTFLIGDVKVEEKGNAPRALKMKDIIKKGALVRTGKDSSAAVQLGDGIVVRVLSESELTFETILEQGTTGLRLGKGTALSKIDKLGKKGSYTIKTGTVVASVRGTTFLTAHEPGKSRIAVKKGTVNIESSENKINKDIEAGKAAVVTASMKEIEISRADALTLKLVDNVELKEKPEDMPREDLEKRRDEIIEKEKKLLKEIEVVKPLPIPEIRKKYGRVDVVTLYSGRVIRGAIISRGPVTKMITPDGPVSFPSSKIRNSRTE
jgi:hypothetical protein